MNAYKSLATVRQEIIAELGYGVSTEGYAFISHEGYHLAAISNTASNMALEIAEDIEKTREELVSLKTLPSLTYIFREVMFTITPKIVGHIVQYQVKREGKWMSASHDFSIAVQQLFNGLMHSTARPSEEELSELTRLF